MGTRQDWEDEAQNWLAWTRTPGHDRWFHEVNLPAFLELLPPTPARLLDIGCGEGRVEALLTGNGYEIIGIDSSPTLLMAAAEHGTPVMVADASALPLGSGSMDHVISFMAMQDIDNLGDAISEAGRVLRTGGHLYLAVLHPIGSAGDFTSETAEAAFVIDKSYLEERRLNERVERDGISMTFNQYHRPLQLYFDGLERAGLAVKKLREVQPDPGFLERLPHATRWATVPIFMHIVAVKLP